MPNKRTLLSFVLLSSLLGANKAQAEECLQVVMSAHPDYPPYHWREGRHIVGASIELTSKILVDLGIPYSTPYIGPWKRVLNVAKQGKLDMVLALKKTKERQEYLDFTSAPAFRNPFAIFVLRDRKFTYRHWQDLVGRKGGKNAGDRYGNAFDLYAKQHLTLDESYSAERNFQKLIYGRIDYFIHGRYVGLAHLAADDPGHRIEVLDTNINEGFIHSAFTKNSPCRYLLPEISQRYTELLANGEAEKILQKNVERWSKWTNAQNN